MKEKEKNLYCQKSNYYMRKTAHKIIFLLFFAAFILILQPIRVQAAELSGHWSEPVVMTCRDYGILENYDPAYNPDAVITRAEFCRMINRSFNYTETSGASSFNDVDYTSGYGNEIRIASAMGYLEGYGGGAAGPNDGLTREQAFTILARIYLLEGDNKAKTNFIDDTNISSWSRGYMNAMTKAGYVKGMGNGYVMPQQLLTKGESAQILANLFGTIIDKRTATEERYKNLTVRSSGITFRNSYVQNDLYITEGIGNGSATLEKATVTGRTLIRGGGSKSIYINGCDLNNVIIDSGVMSFNTHIDINNDTTIRGGIHINTTSSVSYNGVTVSYDIKTGFITFAGKIESVALDETGVAEVITNGAVYLVGSTNTSGDLPVKGFALDQNAVVASIIVNSPTSVTGTGEIKRMEVHSKNVIIGNSVNVNPENIKADKGLPIKIGSNTYTGNGGYLNSQDDLSITAIKITPSSVSVAKGNVHQFIASVNNDSNIPLQDIIWSVEGATADTKINNSGLLTVAAGETSEKLTVRATSVVDETKSGTATVTVTQSGAVMGVLLNKTSVSIEPGKTEILTAIILPTEAANKNITWESSDPTVAVVDINGKITALRIGMAIITVKTEDGGKSAVCIVTVTQSVVTSVTVTAAAPVVIKSGTQKFTAVITGPNNPPQDVIWTVEGGVPGTFINSDGVLSVSAGETAAMLTVRATSKTDSSKSGIATVTIDYLSVVYSVTVTPATVNINKNSRETFTASVYGTTNLAQNVIWTVEGNKSPGTTITATGLLTVSGDETAPTLIVRAISAIDSSKSGVSLITVTQPVNIPATGVTLNQTSAIVNKNSFIQLTASVSPSNASNKAVIWLSNDTSIATVNADGLVTGIERGTAAITVVTEDGGKAAVCIVTVAETSTITKSVTVLPNIVNVTKGGIQQFTAAIEGNSPAETVTWTVEGNKSPATTISSTGTLMVAVDETAASLTVKASGSSDTINSGTAKVTGTVFAGGDGTPSNPYQIDNAAGLQAINLYLSNTFILTSDINISSSAKINWAPIGVIGSGSQFTGRLNGNGYSISGLTIYAEQDYAGLFGYIGTGASVESITLKNVAIAAAGNYAGGIAGYNAGIIQNCVVEGKIEITGDCAGGVAGRNNGTIQNCYTVCNIKGANNIGGIAGYNTKEGIVRCCVALNGTISVSVRSGAVYAGRVTGCNSGGLLASNYAEDGTIVNGAKIDASSTDSLKDGVHGEGITASDYGDKEWWKDTAKWFGPAWDLTRIWDWNQNANLPKLRVIK